MGGTEVKRFWVCLLLLAAPACWAAQPLRVLALYSTDVEQDHVDFAKQAMVFYAEEAKKDGFTFETSTDWNKLADTTLSEYSVVMWLDDFPHNDAQRHGFEHYMEHGGGWLGTHIAAFNNEDTHWPWFPAFLGGAVFYGNSWPPMPAVLTVDDASHPVTKGLPAKFTAPANEWYIWKPDPRDNPSVKVLVTLSPSNYPLGWKDILTGGDVPVVWTNTKYRMLYTNLGHGDKIFTTEESRRMMRQELQWLLSAAEKK